MSEKPTLLGSFGLDVDTPLERQALKGMGSGWPGMLAGMEQTLQN
ncbi:hypothetical protein BI49514_01447 [Brevibacterium iodinum ATCC 49514]|uniref:Uncharacterized protein n=1 Tax=Brevibacterium iodinum ATCC 49514 TaxID=1255616 RepID=A0A2H1IYF6_9MICO|nr:hypothetical protein [Brevibacterium iodinum]SMX80245.1 hypothetical protein BI49514_01447 [Brevibacterium iodinum ATCC 49514]SUW12329.1 Uncharacterised protein [Brevibacterium iodinum]